MIVLADRSRLLALVAVLPFVGCVTLPVGPGVMVFPGTGKTFERFSQDDATCRHFGEQRIAGTTPDQAATSSAVAGALTGAALGAAAGVAIGGGRGAAIGAGSGLLLGSALGSATGAVAGSTVQRRYDVAYTQCMYARGNLVPVSRGFVGGHQQAPPRSAPPPPPG